MFADKSKFKVGDRVRRIAYRNSNNSTAMEIGDIGAIIAKDGDWLKIDGFESLGFQDGRYFQPDSKFAVGDRVRVVKDGEGSYGSGHECDLGTITDITSVDKYGEDVEYLTETGWFFYAREIEPVAADSNSSQPDTLTIREGGYYRTRDGR